MEETIQIGFKNTGRCLLHSYRRIAGLAFQLHTPVPMLHLVRCTAGVSSDMKLIVVHPAEALRPGSVRYPFAMKHLAQVIHETSLSV